MNRFLPLAFVATLLAACSGFDKNEEPETVLFDIVTFEGYDSLTQVSTFTYQVIDDSPLLTLTANWRPTADMAEGTRLMLAYTSATPGESGPVTFKGASRTLGGELLGAASVSADFVSTQVQPVAVWRTGPWLNMRLSAMLTSNYADATLTLDSATVSSATPSVYLALIDPEGYDRPEASMKEAYCSWNIDSVWSLPQVEGLHIIFRTVNGANADYVISKN